MSANVIDSIIGDVRDVVHLIEPAFAFIAVAQAATGVGGATAEQVIKTIRAGLQSFVDVAAGAVTREQALAALAALRGGLAANDAAADRALADKFR